MGRQLFIHFLQFWGFVVQDVPGWAPGWSFPARGAGAAQAPRGWAGGPRDSSVPCPSLGRWICRKGLAASATRVSAQPALGGTGSASQGWKRLRQALTFFLTPPWTAEGLRCAGEQCPAGPGMLGAAPSRGAQGDAVRWVMGMADQAVCLQGAVSRPGAARPQGVRSGGSPFHALAGVSLLSLQPGGGYRGRGAFSGKSEDLFCV